MVQEKASLRMFREWGQGLLLGQPTQRRRLGAAQRIETKQNGAARCRDIGRTDGQTNTDGPADCLAFRPDCCRVSSPSTDCSNAPCSSVHVTEFGFSAPATRTVGSYRRILAAGPKGMGLETQSSSTSAFQIQPARLTPLFHLTAGTHLIVQGQSLLHTIIVPLSFLQMGNTARLNTKTPSRPTPTST
jgi:hypothetical protein